MITTRAIYTLIFSGAGKTTLLNVLAGRVVSTNRVQVSADIRYGYTNIQSLPGGIQKFRQRIAFVPQEDVVNILSTPREAIHFSAKLRLPQSTSNKEIEALVNEYLEKLGLSKCADVIIGGGLKKGISGGQKKRTCIGIELVTDPGLIFLDEPTSGLDAVSAEDLMGLLNQLARAGNVVIFTIHQPSSSIFLSFDKLILLSEGKLMYHGSTTDVPAYFEKAGYALPELENPADWVLVRVEMLDVRIDIGPKAYLFCLHGTYLPLYLESSPALFIRGLKIWWLLLLRGCTYL